MVKRSPSAVFSLRASAHTTPAPQGNNGITPTSIDIEPSSRVVCGWGSYLCRGCGSAANSTIPANLRPAKYISLYTFLPREKKISITNTCGIREEFFPKFLTSSLVTLEKSENFYPCFYASFESVLSTFGTKDTIYQNIDFK